MHRQAAGFTTCHHIDFAPHTSKVSLQQRCAQGQPTRLLGDVEHMTEFDARAWKVGYRADNVGQSLKGLMEERKQIMGLSILFIPTGIDNSQSRIVEAMIKEQRT
jgi:hypothetical protein